MNSQCKTEHLIDHDGELLYVESFLDSRYADECFEQLLHQLQWHQESYTIYGKTVLAPRLVAWYGDKQARYRYSGIDHEPLPWHLLLLQLRNRISGFCDKPFNSVLANLYRSGQDSMGWHADKEPELGRNPVLASLSLGETRLFKLKHTKTKQVVDVELPNGCLLIMAGALQHHWRHSVPKTSRKISARINLTYRMILTDAQ